MGFCILLSIIFMPPAAAPGRIKPENGFASVGVPGGNFPFTGSNRQCPGMKKTGPHTHQVKNETFDEKVKKSARKRGTLSVLKRSRNQLDQ